MSPQLQIDALRLRCLLFNNLFIDVGEAASHSHMSLWRKSTSCAHPPSTPHTRLSPAAYLTGRNVTVVVTRNRQTCGNRHPAGCVTSERVI